MSDLGYFADRVLIAELEKRGYIVRDRKEASRTLMWSRTLPVPEGIDFKSEALDNLRSQITGEMIDIETRPAVAKDMPEITRAVLRVL